MKTETRALSVRQPWATLIVLGRKRIETRPMNTHRTGRVHVHASATKMGPEERALAVREGLDPDALPMGAIVGSVEIVHAIPVEDFHRDAISADERRLGDYRPGRWGWKLAAPIALSTPVKCSGSLSFWRVPADVEAEIVSALASIVAETCNVFVYGTLKRGQGNHRLLEGSTLLGADQLGGEMRSYGGFPAIHLESDATVHGEVYRVNGATLARLDRLEGVPTLYTRALRTTRGGRRVFVYVMRPQAIRHLPLIPTGRWEDRA